MKKKEKNGIIVYVKIGGNKKVRRYIKYVVAMLIIAMIIVTIVIANNRKSKPEDNDETFKVVTSFYPIYIMTANITEGAQNIELVNMTDINVGCIHDYTLTTADMKKIENANVFIENGLELENFIDKITSTNKELEIIDSSQNIQDLIQEDEETNPHIWTSISNNILQVENITKGLIQKNPENAQIYEENSRKYIQKLEELKLKYDEELHMEGQTAVTLNESFAYFGREIGLNLTVIHTSHEESSISAETLKNVIDTMKKNNSKIIIVDIEDDIKNAQTIANETGAKIYKLNSGTTGSMDRQSYINAMEDNLEKLKNET